MLTTSTFQKFDLVPDYDFYRKNSLHQGGGVCIYVRKNHLKVLEIVQKESIERIGQLWHSCFFLF